MGGSSPGGPEVEGGCKGPGFRRGGWGLGRQGEGSWIVNSASGGFEAGTLFPAWDYLQGGRGSFAGWKEDFAESPHVFSFRSLFLEVRMLFAGGNQEEVPPGDVVRGSSSCLQTRS